MRNLNFKVNAQVVEAVGDFAHLVPGSKGYLIAVFDFSDDWNGCTKFASFFDGRKEYAVKLNSNRCGIPDEVCAKDKFKVQLTGVKGNYKIITNKILVRQEV